MRYLKFIAAICLLCGFTYGYNNNVQTGKPDLVVKGVTLSDITGFSNYSSGVKSRLDSTFITQTANPNLPNSQAMGALSTGIVKNTTTTGVQSIAAPVTDYVSGYAGLLAQPTITDNGDGTITVGTALCLLYDNADYTGGARYYSVSGGTFTPTDGSSSTLAIDYNSGSPIMQIQVQGLANFSSNIPVVTMFRSGTSIDFLSWDATANGLAEKTLERLVRTDRFARQSGLALGEAATRTVTITSGITWNGVTKISLNAANSSTDPTTLWAHVAGVYTPTSITQYNNTQYDDGTNLVTLLPNKYAVNWVYRLESITPEIHILLGGGDYNLAAAQASQPPSSLPEVVRTNSILVGRIIVVKSASTATEIDSSFISQFSSSGATVHSDLTNLDYASAGHTGFVGNTGNTAALDMGIYGITAASLTDSGNLTFTGTGNRISGDFSNATVANRVALKSSTTNSSTDVVIAPNGTGPAGSLSIYNAQSSNDPDNSAYAALTINAAKATVTSSVRGTGTQLPLDFLIGTSAKLRIATTGNILAGATTETSGAEKLQVTGAISASGAVLVGGGANTVYYCDAGTSVGNLCRGNGCSCVGGTWVATSLKID